MAHWNTPPISGAERDRAGLETIKLVDSMMLDPRSPIVRLEIAALLVAGVLAETAESTDNTADLATDVLRHLLERIREFARDATQVIEPK